MALAKNESDKFAKGKLGGDDSSGGGTRKYALVFIPYMTPMCEAEILKHNLLDIHIRVIVFPLYFFPLYNDVFSLEIKGLYKEYYVDNDFTNLLMCSFSFMFLQHLFNGVFKNIKSLGQLSHSIVEQLIQLRKEIVATNFDLQAPNKFDEDFLDVITNLQNVQDMRHFRDSGQPLAIPLKYALHKIFLSERSSRGRTRRSNHPTIVEHKGLSTGKTSLEKRKNSRNKFQTRSCAEGKEEGDNSDDMHDGDKDDEYNDNDEDGSDDGSGDDGDGSDGGDDDGSGDGSDDDEDNRDGEVSSDHNGDKSDHLGAPEGDSPGGMEDPPNGVEGKAHKEKEHAPRESTGMHNEKSVKREMLSQEMFVQTGAVSPSEQVNIDSASERSRNSTSRIKRRNPSNNATDGNKSSSSFEEGLPPSRGRKAGQIKGAIHRERRKGESRGRPSKGKTKKVIESVRMKKTDSTDEAHVTEEDYESSSASTGPNFMATEDNTNFLLKKKDKQKMERKNKREKSYLQEKLGIANFNFLLNVSNKIDSCIIIDRKIDMVTPFSTPFTYEGLLDHLFGISNLQIEVPRYIIFNDMNNPGGDMKGQWKEEHSQQNKDSLKNMMVRIKLKNSVDVLYNDIKDLSPNQVGLYLHNKASEIQKTYKEKDTLKDIEEINKFLKKIKMKHFEHNSLSTHVNLASFILTTMKKEPNFNKLKLEDEIIQLNNTSNRTTLHNIVQQIQLLIYSNEDIHEVYRLLCLFSVVTNGFSENYTNEVKKDILEHYGIDELSRINKLHFCNILKHQPKQKFIWSHLRNHFNLLSNEHNDISYVCNGYAPLSVRLIEYMGILKNNMQAFPEIFNLLSGPTLDIVQNPVGYGKFALDKGKKDTPWGENNPDGEKDVVLLFYVGGISYAEIAAIRNLNKHSQTYHYLIFTTEIISSRRLLQSLAAP